MKYIVTGGCGFIGSHLVESLLKLGNDVIVLDDLSTGFERYIETDNPKLTFLKVDISDWSALSRNFAYFQGAEGVFHLAACARIQPSIYDPMLTHDNNVTGTLNVLQMMRMCNITNIVYSASSSAYGKNGFVPQREDDRPDCQSPYAVSKYMGELYCQTWSKLYGLNSTRLRYFNVYGYRSPESGPYAPVIGRFFMQAYSGESITIVGDGEQRRDFTHVSDVVNANILAMNSMPTNSWNHHTKLLNIGTGVNHSMNQIAAMVAATRPRGADIVHVPERIGEARETRADNSAALREIGWYPKINLEDVMPALAAYYKDRAQNNR